MRTLRRYTFASVHVPQFGSKFTFDYSGTYAFPFLHRDHVPCATVKVPPLYLATFQGSANTQTGWIYLFFGVPVFTTGLVTVICPSPPFFGLFVFFSSPWSRDISFFARVYYSCLFSQPVCTVLLSQYSLHEPVLWTSSLPLPGYFLIPSDWCRVPNF